MCTAPVQFPAGFQAYVGHAGVRDSGDDLAIVVAQEGSTAAGVFTQSSFAGHSVSFSREQLAGGAARAVVVIAANANVATGAQGRRDAAELAELAAQAAGVDSAAMLVASTGVIGRRYPMDAIRNSVTAISPRDFTASPEAFAAAIMTTDTHPKLAHTTVTTIAGETAEILGVAKGVGMLEPNMATMLAFVTTDASVGAEDLDAALREVSNKTFNNVSVDTDTSTSDTAVILASGMAGDVAPSEFSAGLFRVCMDLALQLARDGEGATKLLTVTVNGAGTDEQARVVAKSILNSPLVKTAVHGADPNWGRVAMAIGKCEQYNDIDPERVRISFGDLETYPAFPGEEELEKLSSIMSEEQVDISVDLGVRTGGSSCTVYGCDLSREYVTINADYTT